MNKSGIFDRVNRSRVTVAAVCLGIFLVMLVCNLWTDLVADDYRYFFSYADESRIESVADIFPSMAAHRHIMNGRVAAHFLVQLFLLLPPIVFKLINSLVFLALIWLIYSIARQGREHNALGLPAIFGCIWVLQPEFGQVFLWLTGAINYLWCAVLCLAFMLPYLDKLLHDREPSKPVRVLFIIFSALVGAYSENSSVAVIFMVMLVIAVCRFFFKERIESWMYLSLLAAFAGFMYMMLAPAESVNKSAEFSVSVLLSNFVETGAFYLRFWPLLLAWALLFYLAVKYRVELRLRIASLILLLGSLAGHFVLTFAMYCAGRSTYIGFILLLCAVAILFPPLFNGRYKSLLAALCAVSVAALLYFGYTGISDIRRTHIALSYNEQLIAECIANGEKNIQLPRPYARTKYSAIEGLDYLSTEDASDWSNVYMALYYGFDSIIGY